MGVKVWMAFLLAFLKRDKTPKCREYIFKVPWEENRDWEWFLNAGEPSKGSGGVCERV